MLVRKKDSSLRLCVDYRQLNLLTIKDAYALPRIEELLDNLGGNKFYSVMDMKSGYHQVGIEEDQKEYTAFTAGPLGLYEYNCLPFGLSNAPATYQRLMEECLECINGEEEQFCQIYLDDVILASKSFFRTSQPFVACSGAFPDSRHEAVTQEVSHVPGKSVLFWSYRLL